MIVIVIATIMIDISIHVSINNELIISLFLLLISLYRRRAAPERRLRRARRARHREGEVHGEQGVT